MDAQVMFRMTFCSSGLLSDKQLSTKLVSARRSQKCALKGVIQNVNGIDFIFLLLEVVFII